MERFVEQNVAETMMHPTRRDALIKMTTAFAGALLHTANAEARGLGGAKAPRSPIQRTWNRRERSKTITDYMNDFPKESDIPHIARINKYPCNDADFLIVHWRMLHTQEESTQQGNNEALECQKEVRSAILHCMNQKPALLDHLYSEGIHEKTNIDQYLRSFIDKKYNDWEERALWDWGADALLYAENALHIRAAERSWLMLTKDERSEYFANQKLFDTRNNRREDQFLHVIKEDRSKLKNGIAHVLFGCVHDWRNNIANAHKESRSYRYAHMVITPNAVTKYWETPRPPLSTKQTSSQSLPLSVGEQFLK